MQPFEEHLQARLQLLREASLHRALRIISSPQGVRVKIAGREFINFASNDYLGLASHPSVIEASVNAAREYGAGSGASRLICGSMRPHHSLEEKLAGFKGTQAALVFSTGYAAALGTIPALITKGDVIVLDRLVHASIVDAARLSGAEIRVFKHNDRADLESILKWGANRRTLIVTESVFSMDGDLAPLADLVELKSKYCAWLMVDEAHATGLYGAQGKGRIDECGVGEHVEIQMGTLGKALGASGGYIAGSSSLIEFLINSARSFIFSTAPVPAAAAAAEAALNVVASPEGTVLRGQLWARIAYAGQLLKLQAASSPILPVILWDEERALKVADALRTQGFLVPAIRYPTVKRGQARLRVTLSAQHSQEVISELSAALRRVTHS